MIKHLAACLFAVACGAASAANGWWNGYSETPSCVTPVVWRATRCAAENYSYDWDETHKQWSSCAVSGEVMTISQWIAPDIAGFPTASAPDQHVLPEVGSPCNLDSEVGGSSSSGGTGLPSDEVVIAAQVQIFGVFLAALGAVWGLKKLAGLFGGSGRAEA